MTSRERLLACINRKIPDCVPVAPDISNMVPAKRTGLRFWDIYLYRKVSLWKAYIDSVKYFGFDSVMDGYIGARFDELGEIDHDTREYIVAERDNKIYTRFAKKANGKYFWKPTVNVYLEWDPPFMDIPIEKLKMDAEPTGFKPVDLSEADPVPNGEAEIKLAKELMGDHGLVGVWCGTSRLLNTEKDIYDYYDDPEPFYDKRDEILEKCEKRFHHLMSLDNKPDFICTGASGTLIGQSVKAFRELGLPIVKRITELCREYGIPSHIHSCGPEAELVKICAEETDLTIIDPLEIPPMGDCDLRALKQKYGDKLILKGNLHTSKVMLFGSVNDVVEASKKAIDDAAEGGGFILSTGDQCGRDTPEENLFAMIETARTYGRYI